MKLSENDARANTSSPTTCVIMATRGDVIMTSSLAKYSNFCNMKKYF